jgi:hypothetical protein
MNPPAPFFAVLRIATLAAKGCVLIEQARPSDAPPVFAEAAELASNIGAPALRLAIDIHDSLRRLNQGDQVSRRVGVECLSRFAWDYRYIFPLSGSW